MDYNEIEEKYIKANIKGHGLKAREKVKPTIIRREDYTTVWKNGGNLHNMLQYEYTCLNQAVMVFKCELK